METVSNAEGIQGPLNQRNDLKQAKYTCKRLHQEDTAITGSGHKPFLQSNKSDRGAINNLKALKNTHIDFEFLQDGDAIFFHVTFVFIFVITMATKQRLVVKVEL